MYKLEIKHNTKSYSDTTSLFFHILKTNFFVSPQEVSFGIDYSRDSPENKYFPHLRLFPKKIYIFSISEALKQKIELLEDQYKQTRLLAELFGGEIYYQEPREIKVDIVDNNGPLKETVSYPAELNFESVTQKAGNPNYTGLESCKENEHCTSFDFAENKGPGITNITEYKP